MSRGKLSGESAVLAHKNLLLAVEAVLEASQITPDMSAKLRKMANESREWLCSTKSFEYHGDLELKYGAQIKLMGLKMDFDDVLRNVTNKRNDIDVEVYLALTIVPRPKVIVLDKEKEVTTTTTPDTTTDATE